MSEIYERVRTPDIKLKMSYRDWFLFPEKIFPYLGMVLSKEGYPIYAYHTTHFQLVEIEIIPDEFMYEKFPQSSASKVKDNET